MSNALIEPTGDALIGERVRLLMNRARPRITQARVAFRLGLSQPSFGQRLLGNTRWTAVELLAVSDMLGTTVAFLVGETDVPYRGPAGLKHSDAKSGFEPDSVAVAGAGLEPATPRL
jgi:hypothetical protein